MLTSFRKFNTYFLCDKNIPLCELTASNPKKIPQCPKILNLKFFSHKLLQIFHLMHIVVGQDDIIYIQYKNRYLSILRLFKKHGMVTLTLSVPIFEKKLCESFKLSSRWLLEAMEEFFKLANLFISKHLLETKWGVHIHFFLQFTMQKCIFYIQLK